MIDTVASIIRGLSPMQSVVLHYAISAPDSGLYIVQIVGNLPRDVDLQAFERAWADVVTRHAILKTALSARLRVRGSSSTQAHCALQLHDWRGLDVWEQGEALQRFVVADRTTGFDLRKPPLMRLSVVRLTDEDRVFIWTYHHLLIDSRARFILLTEVDRLYKSHAYVLDLSYDRDAFDDATIEQAAWRLVSLLKAMQTGADRTIAQLLPGAMPRRVWARGFRSVDMGGCMPGEIGQYGSRIDDDAKILDVTV